MSSGTPPRTSPAPAGAGAGFGFGCGARRAAWGGALAARGGGVGRVPGGVLGFAAAYGLVVAGYAAAMRSAAEAAHRRGAAQEAPGSQDAESGSDADQEEETGVRQLVGLAVAAWVLFQCAQNP